MQTAHIVDLGFVAIANAVNLLLALLMLSRPRGMKRLEEMTGLITVSLVIPIALGITVNATEARPWWTTVLPSVLLLYLSVELVLDYVQHSDFRETRLIWPYLVLFYFALSAMIGYAFAVGPVYGVVTLATYFVCLIATWYSYSRVGHSRARG